MLENDLILCCIDIMRRVEWRKLNQHTNMCHLVRTVLPYKSSAERHDHDFAEIFWVEEGAGFQLLGNTECPMTKGDLFIVRKSDTHAPCAAPGTRCMILNIAFRAEVMTELTARYFPDRRDFISGRLPQPRFSLSTQTLRRFSLLADQLSYNRTSRFALDHLLLCVFHELLARHQPDLPGDTPEWLRNACDRIRTPELLARGTAGFVQLAGRCKEHVSRAAKKHLGRTPTEIVNEARMAYATHLLSLSEAKIADISCQCGFDSLTHFYKLFHRRYGVSPKQYRQNSSYISNATAPGEIALVDKRTA